MKIKWLILIVLIIILAYCQTSEAINFNSEEKESLEILVKTSRLVYHKDKEIMIYVFFKNNAEEALELLEPAIDKKSLMFEIVQPDGKKEKLLDIYGLNLKKIILPQDKRIKFKANFIPEMLGTYQINVSYFGFQDKEIKARPISVYVVSPPRKEADQ
ncbi:MAG: hypothetical protein ABIG64_00910 [Candidatus Omnitrophota bacterium]